MGVRDGRWDTMKKRGKKRGRKEEREREGLSTLEKRSFTVVDVTVIRNGTLSVATLTTTIASSPLRLLRSLRSLIGDKPLREMSFVRHQ